MQNSKVEFMKSSPDLSFWVHFSEGYYTVFYWLDKVTFLKCDLVTLCCIRSTIGIDHSVSNSLCTLYCTKTQKTLHDTIHTLIRFLKFRKAKTWYNMVLATSSICGFATKVNGWHGDVLVRFDS